MGMGIRRPTQAYAAASSPLFRAAPVRTEVEPAAAPPADSLDGVGAAALPFLLEEPVLEPPPPAPLERQPLEQQPARVARGPRTTWAGRSRT